MLQQWCGIATKVRMTTSCVQRRKRHHHCAKTKDKKLPLKNQAVLCNPKSTHCIFAIQHCSQTGNARTEKISSAKVKLSTAKPCSHATHRETNVVALLPLNQCCTSCTKGVVPFGSFFMVNLSSYCDAACCSLFACCLWLWQSSSWCLRNSLWVSPCSSSVIWLVAVSKSLFAIFSGSGCSRWNIQWRIKAVKSSLCHAPIANCKSTWVTASSWWSHTSGPNFVWRWVDVIACDDDARRHFFFVQIDNGATLLSDLSTSEFAFTAHATVFFCGMCKMTKNVKSRMVFLTHSVAFSLFNNMHCCCEQKTVVLSRNETMLLASIKSWSTRMNHIMFVFVTCAHWWHHGSSKIFLQKLDRQPWLFVLQPLTNVTMMKATNQRSCLMPLTHAWHKELCGHAKPFLLNTLFNWGNLSYDQCFDPLLVKKMSVARLPDCSGNIQNQIHTARFLEEFVIGRLWSMQLHNEPGD